MWGAPGLNNAAANPLGRWFLQIAGGARERETRGLLNKAARRKSTDKKNLLFFFLSSSAPTRRMADIWLGGGTPICVGCESLSRGVCPEECEKQDRDQRCRWQAPIAHLTSSCVVRLRKLEKGGNRFNSGTERAGKIWAGLETGFGGALYEARRAVKDRGFAGCEFG
jgi:hypothetical protein